MIHCRGRYFGVHTVYLCKLDDDTLFYLIIVPSSLIHCESYVRTDIIVVYLEKNILYIYH